MSDTSKQHQRPLSPHLQVYRLPLAAKLSISHRITGSILAGGLLLITAFLVSAAMGPDYYNMIMEYAVMPYGTAFLFVWSFVLFFHMCNGLRHLVWDTASFMERRQAFISSLIVLTGAVALTAAIWYCATR